MGEFGSSRREFLRALSGAVGVAIVADAGTVADLAEAAKPPRDSAIPDDYVFERVLTVGDGTPGLGDVEQIMQGVMINDRSEVIFPAQRADGGRSVYRMRIGRGPRPKAETPRLIVGSGQTLPNGQVVERIAAGDTNAKGTYVTVVRAKGGFDYVCAQSPGRPMAPIIGPSDLIPGATGHYSGHFGDVDIDEDGTVLLVARYTLPGELQQGLFALPGGGRQGGRILLRTGQRIPQSRAVITGLGLIERRGGYFIQQVFGRQPSQRGRQDLGAEPSGFVVGKVARGRNGARLLVGARELNPQRSVVTGQAFVGPRVDRNGVAATVTHKRGSKLDLHRHEVTPKRATRMSRSGAKTRKGDKVETISAPLFGPDGLLYYRVISKKGMELLVVDGDARETVLETGRKVNGARMRGFNLGWHTDQVDSRGRLAFQADLYDGRTAIVIGTPVKRKDKRKGEGRGDGKKGGR